MVVSTVMKILTMMKVSTEFSLYTKSNVFVMFVSETVTELLLVGKHIEPFSSTTELMSSLFDLSIRYV